jgi:hypothetical protein
VPARCPCDESLTAPGGLASDDPTGNRTPRDLGHRAERSGERASGAGPYRARRVDPSEISRTRDLAVIKRGLSLAAAGRAAAAPALGALAALLYTRPELVDDAVLARLLANASAPGPLGARRDTINLCAALAATPLAPRLLPLLRATFAEDGLNPATREALVPLLRDFVQWRSDLLGLHLVLEMAGPAAMAPYRTISLAMWSSGWCTRCRRC